MIGGGGAAMGAEEGGPALAWLEQRLELSLVPNEGKGEQKASRCANLKAERRNVRQYLPRLGKLARAALRFCADVLSPCAALSLVALPWRTPPGARVRPRPAALCHVARFEKTCLQQNGPSRFRGQ